MQTFTSSKFNTMNKNIVKKKLFPTYRPYLYNSNVKVHAVNSSASLQNTPQRIQDIHHQVLVMKTVISMNLPHIAGDSPSCLKLFLPRLPIQLNWRESGLVINAFIIPLTVSEIPGAPNVLRYLACNTTAYIFILNQNKLLRCGKQVSANQRLINLYYTAITDSTATL